MSDLSDRVVLVTGAATGIGLGIAEVVGKAGATVLLNDKLSDRAERATAALQERGIRAEFHVADVTKPADVEHMMAAISKRWQRLDGLVNNAGFAQFGGVTETTPEIWDALLNVHLRAHFLVVRSALALLRAAREASVVSISSVHSLLTTPTLLAYATAKGGVTAMVRALAQELGPWGVRINAVSPGFVDTPLFRAWLEGEPDPEASMRRVLDNIPLRRIGSPEDVGNLVAFLLSERASLITGTNLVVDGGLTTQLMH
jgi:NAD(P)-dependent dehydrogenase (short-subunit alcohol dehydrogenase family)